MSNYNFSEEFEARFNDFRALEWATIKGKSNEDSCPKAFSLLRDMELCYAAKSYYACLIIACASIEACLNHKFGNEGNLRSKIEKSGYKDDADWLRELRNEIIHKNNSQFVTYVIESEKELQLDIMCKKAFVLVHTVYYDPIKKETLA